MTNEYVKRIIIISPDSATQDYLENTSWRHFADEIVASKKRVIVQKYENINLSYQVRAEVGQGGEILVILDRALFPYLHGLRNDLARGLIDAFRHNCTKLKIPYAEYDDKIPTAKLLLDKFLRNAKPGVLECLASNSMFSMKLYQ